MIHITNARVSFWRPGMVFGDDDVMTMHAILQIIDAQAPQLTAGLFGLRAEQKPVWVIDEDIWHRPEGWPKDTISIYGDLAALGQIHWLLPWLLQEGQKEIPESHDPNVYANLCLLGPRIRQLTAHPYEVVLERERRHFRGADQFLVRASVA